MIGFNTYLEKALSLPERYVVEKRKCFSISIKVLVNYFEVYVFKKTFDNKAFAFKEDSPDNESQWQRLTEYINN